jgi:hypothetical protein
VEQGRGSAAAGALTSYDATDAGIVPPSGMRCGAGGAASPSIHPGQANWSRFERGPAVTERLIRSVRVFWSGYSDRCRPFFSARRRRARLASRSRHGYKPPTLPIQGRVAPASNHRPAATAEIARPGKA